MIKILSPVRWVISTIAVIPMFVFATQAARADVLPGQPILLRAYFLRFPPVSNDGTANVAQKIHIVIPQTLKVDQGVAGSGFSELYFDNDTTCVYRGGQFQNAGTKINYYAFQYCASGIISDPGSITNPQTLKLKPGDVFEVSSSIDLHITSAIGNFLTKVETTITSLPPDPTSQAPPVQTSQVGNMISSLSFLYSGVNPIQTGVAPGTIHETTLAVLRGKIFDAAQNPQGGVIVTAVGHPEYGQTLTRIDGAYDLVVNGGAQVTLKFSKTGYLGSQRSVQAPWRNFAILPDVNLVQIDSKVTTVTFSTKQAVAAQGSAVSDKDGTRTATAIFPAGTTATMTLPDGSTQVLNSINFRATEYTKGPNGPKAMPAELPATSFYTYAVDLTSDEAIANGATKVTFSQPVYNYVDNFLGFKTGMIIPNGYFDKTKNIWIPAANGLVINILSVTNGFANIDVTGSGAPASASQLAALNFTDQERRQLARLYAPPKSLWRSPVTHFSIWDSNLGPYGQNYPPNMPPPSPPDQTPQCPMTTSTTKGSIININSQILSEKVDIAGTPFSLYYSSQRTLDRKAEYTINIPVTPAQVASNVLGETVVVNVAGRWFTQDFPPGPNQTYTFTWDGKDGYGRDILSPQTAHVVVIYHWGTYYEVPSQLPFTFGVTGSGYNTGVPARAPQDNVLAYFQTVGTLDSRALGLGGLSLNLNHRYDPVSHDLFMGDGTSRFAQSTNYEFSRFAGLTGAPIIDGVPAVNSGLYLPWQTATGADGSVYIVTGAEIRKVSPDGIISTVEKGISFTVGATITSPNFMWVINGSNPGYLYAVYGNGVNYLWAGGGPLDDTTPIYGKQANLANPVAITATPNNIIFIATNDGAIHRFDPYGSGQIYKLPNVHLDRHGLETALTVTPDGSTLYAANPTQILQIPMNGTPTQLDISQLAGFPDGTALDPAGSLIVGTTAGNLYKYIGGKFIPIPLFGQINAIHGLSVGANGSFYWGDRATNEVFAAHPLFPNFTGSNFSVTSSDGSQLFDFDAFGKHLATRDTLTGVTIYSFQYDQAGYLASIQDRNGNTTAIARDANENPIRITSPYGVTTNLTTYPDGRVASISNPQGETHSFSYYPGTGLLQKFTTPRGLSSYFTFDPMGFLTSDQNPAGGTQSISRQVLSNIFPVQNQLTYTSAQGVQTTYTSSLDVSNNAQKTTTSADGVQVTEIALPTGQSQVISTDQSASQQVLAPDPRYGMQAPYSASGSTTYTLFESARSTDTFVRSKTITYGTPATPLSPPPFQIIESVKESSNPFFGFAPPDKIYKNVFDSQTMTQSYLPASGRNSVTSLDSLGQPVGISKAGFAPTTLAYDSQGNLKNISQSTRSSTLSYNAQGFLSSTTDSLNRTTGFTYDGAGRILTETLPDSRQIGFSYDPDGNLTSVTPPGRPPHSFLFNVLNLLSTDTPPDVGTGPTSTQYSYNFDKKITKLLRPDGSEADFYYNSQTGKLSSITTPQGTRLFDYNPTTGRLQNISMPVAPGSLTGSKLYMHYYTSSNNTGVFVGGAIQGFTQEELTSWGTDVFTIRAVPGLASFIWYNTFSPQVFYVYDSDHLLIRSLISVFGSLGQFDFLDYTREAQSGLIEKVNFTAQNWLSFPTNVDPTQGISTTEALSHDEFGDLASQSSTGSGTSTLYSFNLTRDNGGRIASKNETISGTNPGRTNYKFSYDQAGRLTDVKTTGTQTTTHTAHYAFDLNSNRTSVTRDGVTTSATYNNQDEIISSGTLNYTYTKNGEVSDITDTATGQSKSFQYDVFGHLLGVALPSKSISYIVDADGRRIGRIANGQVTDEMLYQGNYRPLLWMVQDSQGHHVFKGSFIYGSKPNSPDAMLKLDQGIYKSYKIISDERGSVRLVIDGTDGSIAQRIDYDEFGRVITDTNPGFQPFGFAGGWYDNDTKLVHFGERDYDPETGRWMQRDPIGFSGGDVNLYGYTLGDPVNGVDPSGNQSLGIGACAALNLGKTLADRTDLIFERQNLIQQNAQLQSENSNQCGGDLGTIQKNSQRIKEIETILNSSPFPDILRKCTPNVSSRPPPG